MYIATTVQSAMHGSTFIVRQNFNGSPAFASNTCVAAWYTFKESQHGAVRIWGRFITSKSWRVIRRCAKKRVCIESIFDAWSASGFFKMFLLLNWCGFRQLHAWTKQWVEFVSIYAAGWAKEKATVSLRANNLVDVWYWICILITTSGKHPLWGTRKRYAYANTSGKWTSYEQNSFMDTYLSIEALKRSCVQMHINLHNRGRCCARRPCFYFRSLCGENDVRTCKKSSACVQIRNHLPIVSNQTPFSHHFQEFAKQIVVVVAPSKSITQV